MVSTFKRHWAIAIGINQYTSGIPGLQTAVGDAQAIAQSLSQQHGYQVQLWLDGQASLSNLRRLFQATLPSLVQAEDRLLVYFAGHGIALNGDKGPEGFLVPQDARLGETQTYWPMVELQAALEALPCRHLLTILDCCFGGAFRWSSTREISFVPEVIHRERYERFLLDPAWQVITSAAYDQRALDSFSLKDGRGQTGEHSPFAAALLEALAGKADRYPPASGPQPGGDGVITATELYLYLRDRVEAPTHERGLRQTPSLFPLSKHDKGEYVFLTPGHPLNLPPAPPLDISQNPYRGLEAFEEEHAALFFGQESRIEQLCQHIIAHPLTVVVGPSGSGKSSLVKAGVLPRFRQEEQWQIAGPMRPGTEPIELFAQGIRQLCNQEITADALQPQSLAQGLEHWQRDNPGRRLLWVVDQFEELLTLCDLAHDRELVLALLAAAIAQASPQFRLVLTLRSDFEPQFQDSTLQPWWSQARFVVPPMGRADLRAAIEQPAFAKVMYFQSEEGRSPLVDQIIDEVVDMPGALPLLSFTLSELFSKYLERQQLAQQRGESLDRAILASDYRALGGVARSLTQRADQEYDALCQQDPAYSQTLPQVMLRLVALSGGEVARRRVPLVEFDYGVGAENKRVQTILQHFSAVRLLVEGQDVMGKPYIEPAHDALVRGWPRLLAWQRQAENLALQRRLTAAALEWGQVRQLRFLWNADPRLEVLYQMLKQPAPVFNQLEAEFVQQSMARRRFNQRLRRGLGIAFLLTVTTFLGISLWIQRRARIEETRAAKQSARGNLRLDNSLDGLLDSLKAAQALKTPLLRLVPPSGQLQNQVRSTLEWSMYHVREQQRWLEHEGPVRSQWSPDGQWLASAGEDGWIRVWDGTGQQVAQWQGDRDRLWFVRFSPDSRTLASAGEDGVIRLWNLQGEQLAELKGHQGQVRYLAFSPDGKLLASTGGEDGELILWQLQSQTAKVRWQVDSRMAKAVNFHPRGDRLATVGRDGKILLWDLQGRLLLSINQHAWNVVFTPPSLAGGDRLVAAGDDGTVSIWSLKGERLAQWQADNQRLWNVAVRPDGAQLATAGEDGRVRLWTLQGQPLGDLQGHRGPVRSVSFVQRPQPQTWELASGGDDGTVRIWQPQTRETLALKVSDGPVLAVRGLGENRLVSADGSDRLQLWQLQTDSEGHPAQAEPPKTVVGTSGSMSKIDGDATGRWLATVGQGGKLLLWDLQQQRSVWSSPASFRAMQAIALSPNGQWLVGANSQGQIQRWQIQGEMPGPANGGGQVRSLAQIKASEPVVSLRISPDSRLLASGTREGGIQIWDLATGQLRHQFQEHIGPVLAVAFSRDGRRLVSGGNDGTVRVWDLERDQSLGSPLPVYGQAVTTVAFGMNAETVVSGDRQGSLQVWDLQSQDLAATWEAHGKGVNDLQLSGDGRWWVTAGGDGLVKLWAIAPLDELMQQGCDRVQVFLQAGGQATVDHLCREFLP